MFDLEKMGNTLQQTLSSKRFLHTQGVMYTSAALAMRYGVNLQAAMIAGLLHDCGKYGSFDEQIRRCQQLGVELSVAEQEIKSLVHAPLGAYLAEHEYHVGEQHVLDAIRYHSTGRPKMSLLEKIIYLADFIEPNRIFFPELEEIRKLAFIDINRAVAQSAASTISFLHQSGRAIDPKTIQTLEYYGGKQKDE